MTATIIVYCEPELKDMSGEAADRAGVPLSEWVARVLAAHFGRPELGKIPRKPIGRPRTKAVAS